MQTSTLITQDYSAKSLVARSDTSEGTKSSTDDVQTKFAGSVFSNRHRNEVNKGGSVEKPGGELIDTDLSFTTMRRKWKERIDTDLINRQWRALEYELQNHLNERQCWKWKDNIIKISCKNMLCLESSVSCHDGKDLILFKNIIKISWRTLYSVLMMLMAIVAIYAYF